MLLTKLYIKNKLVQSFQEGINKKNKKMRSKKQVQKICFFSSLVLKRMMYFDIIEISLVFYPFYHKKTSFCAAYLNESWYPERNEIFH